MTAQPLHASFALKVFVFLKGVRSPLRKTIPAGIFCRMSGFVFQLPWETFSKEQRCGASPGDTGLKKKKKRGRSLFHTGSQVRTHTLTHEMEKCRHTQRKRVAERVCFKRRLCTCTQLCVCVNESYMHTYTQPLS